MEFPEDIANVIREFSKPMTRTDWRLGSRLKREMINIPQINIDDDMPYEFINWEVDMDSENTSESYYRTFICITNEHGFTRRWVFNRQPFHPTYIIH